MDKLAVSNYTARCYRILQKNPSQNCDNSASLSRVIHPNALHPWWKDAEATAQDNHLRRVILWLHSVWCGRKGDTDQSALQTLWQTDQRSVYQDQPHRAGSQSQPAISSYCHPLYVCSGNREPAEALTGTRSTLMAFCKSFCVVSVLYLSQQLKETFWCLRVCVSVCVCAKNIDIVWNTNTKLPVHIKINKTTTQRCKSGLWFQMIYQTPGQWPRIIFPPDLIPAFGTLWVFILDKRTKTAFSLNKNDMQIVWSHTKKKCEPIHHTMCLYTVPNVW